jgi:DNA gyrase subunit A
MSETPIEGRFEGESIEPLSLVDEMQESYLTYAMSVITSRALPDARDGLKPSQRRILVAMNDLNLGPRSQHRKCAKIAGDTSGNYHPHGEQVIYPTLVRLAQKWNMRSPLVDGQGNFGSIDGDPPAAMRYTEARLAAPATELLGDLEYATVDFAPNYDTTRTEPLVLPSKFPNLLVNGCSGIAVGMATSMPPHNLREVCDALMLVIDNPNCTLEEIMTVLPGPDFPTYGEICGRRGILDAYRTGRGSVTMRGKLAVVEGRKGKRTIIISEIPYQVLRCTITERIATAVKAGTIQDVAAVNDASDRKHPIRIEIDLKRDANEDVVINQLFRYTPLQQNFSIINTALVKGQPQTLPIKSLLSIYIDHRREVIRRRTEFLLRRASQKAHILEALILAVGDIDEIIRLIRSSKSPDEAKTALMSRDFRLTESETLHALLPERFVNTYSASAHRLSTVQAGAILSMQLQRLTGLEIEKLAGDYSKLVKEVEGYEHILSDERHIYDIIREDLREIGDKYGDARRTQISEYVGDFSIEELIPDEQVVVTVSHAGYVKRTDIDSYRKQGRGGRGVRGGDSREGDFIEQLFVANTHDYLLVFTDRGRVYWLRVFDLPSLARTSRGRALANLVQMREDEKHRSILPVREFEESFSFFATANGTVKKTPMAAFSRPRANGIYAITLDEGDELIGVGVTSGESEIVLGTSNGMAARFKETDVRAMGRTARGVRGISLAEGDRVVEMVAVQPGDSVLTVCENGYGKRTAINEYRLIRRGGKGVINIKATERNGAVVALRAVGDDDELMIITAGGIMLRTDLSAVRAIGRNTQGVRLIRVDKGDKVVSVAKLVTEANDDENLAEDASDGETTTNDATDDDTSTGDATIDDTTNGDSTD